MPPKVLFFSAHSGIWVHAFPEALLADAVRAAGAELVYVTCDGALSSFCVTMAAQGLRMQSAPEDKTRVCAQCRYNRDAIRQGFGFDGVDFESVLDAADESRIDQIISGVEPRQITSLEVCGVMVGRAALYEYLIQKKKLDLDEKDWEELRPRLANALRSLLAAEKLLDRERPTRVVMFNTLYSVNAVWRALADLRGIPVYFLHSGPGLANRLRSLMVGRDATTRWLGRLVAAWPRYQYAPCNDQELAAVTDHFAELFRGTNVFAYSAPKSQKGDDWRARFGIRPEQKLMVATMSSYDEYLAARMIGEAPDSSGLLFPSQLEWLRALIEWFRTRSELFLLIRVHPREFPNKREGVKSEHAQLLERELSSLPPNVRVNWPSDGVSLYDIAEHTDAFLSAWSSAGKEMALLGLPVVIYCPDMLQYPADLNYVGTTREAYFGAIERALRDGWSFENTRRAYRWCALEYSRAIVDIADGFDFSEAPPSSITERLGNLFLMLPGLRQQRDLARRPRLLGEQRRIGELILSGNATLLDVAEERAPATASDESRTLRREVRRLMSALYGGSEDAPPPGSLRARLYAASRG